MSRPSRYLHHNHTILSLFRVVPTNGQAQDSYTEYLGKTNFTCCPGWHAAGCWKCGAENKLPVYVRYGAVSITRGMRNTSTGSDSRFEFDCRAVPHRAACGPGPAGRRSPGWWWWVMLTGAVALLCCWLRGLQAGSLGTRPGHGPARGQGTGGWRGWRDQCDARERQTTPHNPQTGRTRSPLSRVMVARHTTIGVFRVGATPASVPPTGSASVGPPTFHIYIRT